MLHIENLKKVYGKNVILNGISLDIQDGEIVSVLGPSGSGKTTLLNCILGITKIDGGHLIYNNEDITNVAMEQRGFNIVFQDYALFPNLNAYQNIIYGLKNKPELSNEEEVQELIELLGLKEHLNKSIDQLSGGQKQRVALARALAAKPAIILADEPTGALDSHSSQMLLSTIQSINEDLGATILMVTHDAFSASYANRILFLRDGAIFTEILKGSDSRRVFFEKILDVLTMMGGGVNDVR